MTFRPSGAIHALPIWFNCALLIVTDELCLSCIYIEADVTSSWFKTMQQGLIISNVIWHECQIMHIFCIYDGDSRVSAISSIHQGETKILSFVNRCGKRSIYNICNTCSIKTLMWKEHCPDIRWSEMVLACHPEGLPLWCQRSLCLHLETILDNWVGNLIWYIVTLFYVVCFNQILLCFLNLAVFDFVGSLFLSLAAVFKYCYFSVIEAVSHGTV